MKILHRLKTILVTALGYKKEIQHWGTCLYYVLKFQTTAVLSKIALDFTLI